MTDLIKNLELLKAEIEWDYSIEYQIVIDEVIKKLKEIKLLIILYKKLVKKCQMIFVMVKRHYVM